METLRQLKDAVAKVERRLGSLRAERDRLDRRRAWIQAEIVRLMIGHEPVNGSKPKSKGRRAPGVTPLTAWILRQNLPATLDTLAERAKRAGFSGKPNAVASAVRKSLKLQRLKDGRVGYA